MHRENYHTHTTLMDYMTKKAEIAHFMFFALAHQKFSSSKNPAELLRVIIALKIPIKLA
jgi:hypothetical protein